MSSFVINQNAPFPSHDGGAASPDRLRFHRRLPDYAPTPLVAVPELASRNHIDALFVKDESARCGLPAYKILGASWSVYRMVEEATGIGIDEWETFDELAAVVAERLGRWKGLVAATDGNHGRAVARMGAYLGFPVQILVPAGTRGPRIDAITAEGANVEVIEGTYDDAVREAERRAGDGWIVVADTSSDPDAAGPRWVIEGYRTMLEEVDQQLAEAGEPGPTVIVVPVGVGSLLAAVVAHYGQKHPPVRIVSVEPVDAACVFASIRAGGLATVAGPHGSIMAGLNCGRPSAVAWKWIFTGVSVAVAIPDGAAISAVRELRRYGIESGESGAASLAGLEFLSGVSGTGAPEGMVQGSDRVLLLSTEGATDPDSYRRAIG